MSSVKFSNRIRNLLIADEEGELFGFVQNKLASIPKNQDIIDIGAGSQRYRPFCKHLNYYAQDFGQSPTGLGSSQSTYDYGKIDYLGNCWAIDEQDAKFDAVLCTEVLEHVPYPAETVREISRLLKRNGQLIMTVPCTSLRHMNPYWFQPGLSDNWIRYFFDLHGLEIVELHERGNYSTWILSELVRVLAYYRWAAPFLLPAIIFFKFFMNIAKHSHFDQLLTSGWWIVARKI